jgi:hypothetical protein
MGLSMRKPAGEQSEPAGSNGAAMPVHHMVLLRFKPAATAAVVDQLFAALADLKKTIPGIVHFAGGPYSSPEGFNQGFTHGFLMTFTDPAARDAYLVDPEHEKVKQTFLPLVDNVVAFDFVE